MTNLELAGKLQASSARNDDLVGLLWDAGAALRNLHTENTALRVNEENLRQELQECQDQRRAAFRRIEELDAMRAQIGQGVPEIDYEALIAAAYKRDRKWAQGTNGCVAFKCGAEWFRSQMLASTHPVPQQKPLLQRIEELERKSDQDDETIIWQAKKISEKIDKLAERDARIAELEQRNSDLHEDVQRFKQHALNEKAARLELERQLEEARKDVKPCPTCESLARAVMLDQTGKA